jgi:hypothetical protein
MCLPTFRRHSDLISSAHVGLPAIECSAAAGATSAAKADESPSQMAFFYGNPLWQGSVNEPRKWQFAQPIRSLCPPSAGFWYDDLHKDVSEFGLQPEK